MLVIFGSFLKQFFWTIKTYTATVGTFASASVSFLTGKKRIRKKAVYWIPSQGQDKRLVLWQSWLGRCIRGRPHKNLQKVSAGLPRGTKSNKLEVGEMVLFKMGWNLKTLLEQRDKEGDWGRSKWFRKQIRSVYPSKCCRKAPVLVK